jgi:hypothetical protein
MSDNQGSSNSYEDRNNDTWRYVDSPSARGRTRKQSPFFDIKSSHNMIMNMSKDGDLLGSHSEHGPHRYIETSFTRPHTSTGLCGDFYNYDGVHNYKNNTMSNRKSNQSPFTSINNSDDVMDKINIKLAAHISGAPRTPPLPIQRSSATDRIMYNEEIQQPIPFPASSADESEISACASTSASPSPASVSGVDDLVEMWSTQMSTSNDNENRNFFFHDPISGSAHGQESNRNSIGGLIDRNSKGNLFQSDLDLEHSELKAHRHSADIIHDQKSANRFESAVDNTAIDNRLDVSIRSDEGGRIDRTHYFSKHDSNSLLLVNMNESDNNNSSNNSSSTDSADHLKIMIEEVAFVETQDLYDTPLSSTTSSPIGSGRSGFTSPNTSSELDAAPTTISEQYNNMAGEGCTTAEFDNATLDSPRLIDSSEHYTTCDDMTAERENIGTVSTLHKGDSEATLSTCSSSDAIKTLVNDTREAKLIQNGYEQSIRPRASIDSDYSGTTKESNRSNEYSKSNEATPMRVRNETSDNVKTISQQDKYKIGHITSPIRFSYSDTKLAVDSGKSMLIDKRDKPHTRSTSTSMLHMLNNKLSATSSNSSASSPSSASSSARISPDFTEHRRAQRPPESERAMRKVAPHLSAFPLTLENIKAQNNRFDYTASNVIRRRKVLLMENFKRNPSNDSFVFPFDDDGSSSSCNPSRTPSPRHIVTSKNPPHNGFASIANRDSNKSLVSLGDSDGGDTMMMLGDMEL